MKIMIFGDAASGKSTFAKKLAVIENLPVIHLDEVMQAVGRTDRNSIASRIEKEVGEPNWIIDGNAFTKDKKLRIQESDLVIVFDFNRFYSLFNHLRRDFKFRTNQEIPVGNEKTPLHLTYFVPYILRQFPRRKKQAIQQAKSLDKAIIIFHNRKDASQYLKSR